MSKENSAPKDPKLELNKDLTSLVIKELEPRIQQIIEDPEIRESLLKDIQELLADISEMESTEDLPILLNVFLAKIEQKPATEGIHRLTYKVRSILESLRTQVSTITDDEDNPLLQIYSQHVNSRDLDKDAQAPGRLKNLRNSLQTLFAKFNPRNFNQRVALSLAKNAGIAGTSIAATENIQTLQLPKNISDAFKITTGLVFAAYTIYVALLLASEEGKATRGATSLEILCAQLIDYAEENPESLKRVEEALEELETGLAETGNFTKATTAVRKAYISTRSTVDKTALTQMKQDLATHKAGLEEACRASVSTKTRGIIDGGGGALTLLSSLSGETAGEKAVFAAVAAVVVSELQDVVYDLDQPWGQEGVMKLSTEPIETARTHLEAIRKRFHVKRQIRAHIEASEQIDSHIVNSFYKCFRDIFDPWQKNVERAELVETDYIRTNLSSSDSLTDVTKAAQEFRMKMVTEGPAKPKFLFGQETVEEGALDMTKLMSFRYNDSPEHQLALLEATIKKIERANDMESKEKSMAIALMKQWITKLNGKKEIIRDSESQAVEPKTAEQQVKHAVEAIFGEIKDNITTKGSSAYVFKRREGSRHIETETANRQSDWEEENIQTYLNPIHVRLIRKLTDEAKTDKDNTEKYQAVITNINNVRREQGMHEILVA